MAWNFAEELKSGRVITLHNRACIYCGFEFDHDVPFTVEHVVGRRFVPKASLENEWNLICRACPRCNQEKADLEDEISAASLYPWMGTETVDSDVLSKVAGSFSRTTGKPVAESEHRERQPNSLHQLRPAVLHLGLATQRRHHDIDCEVR